MVPWVLSPRPSVLSLPCSIPRIGRSFGREGPPHQPTPKPFLVLCIVPKVHTVP